MFLCSESGRDHATATRMAQENAKVVRKGQILGLMRMLILEEFNCEWLDSNAMKKAPREECGDPISISPLIYDIRKPVGIIPAPVKET